MRRSRWIPFGDSPNSTVRYMTELEQQKALADAGFHDVMVNLSLKGLVVYAAHRAT